MKYSNDLKVRSNPTANEAIPGREADMKQTLSGGMAFKATDLMAVDRWLNTGTNGSLFYEDRKSNFNSNLDFLKTAYLANPTEVSKLIIKASEFGLSNSTPILATAYISTMEPKSVFRNTFNQVIRTLAHIYEFMDYVKKFRGFGRTVKNAISNWISNNPNLEYQILKYGQRNGWSFKDVLRLTHVKADSEEKNELYKWAVGKENKASDIFPRINVISSINNTIKQKEVANHIRKHRLTLEMVRGRITSPGLEINEALFEGMPLNATIRNISNLTKHGVLSLNKPSNINLLEKKLLNIESLRKAKVHPFHIIQAMKMCGNIACAPVLDILDEAVKLSFGALEPTGKVVSINIDVSPSMGGVATCGLEMYKIAGILALSFAKTEKYYEVNSFSSNLTPVKGINKNTSYLDLLDYRKTPLISNNFGSTNPSSVYKNALEKSVKIDSFITITDNELNSGMQPSSSLNAYRKALNPNAKAFYITLAPYKDAVTLADPNDPNAYDLCGFGSNTPNLIKYLINS